MTRPIVEQEVAFTSPAPIYPPFVNFKRRGNVVTISVRSEPREGQEGRRAFITLSTDEFYSLLRNAGEQIWG
jgi:hypothetical protein